MSAEILEIPEALWVRGVREVRGCWIWTASRDRYGYGQVHASDITQRAHRWAYQLLVGPIPHGLHLDHLCRVLACVRPEHLEPVTNAENMRRRAEANRHCSHGHEYTEANTYISSDGRRHCRHCGRIRAAAYQARKRATS